MKQKNGVIVLSISLIVLGVLYWYWAELIPRSMGPAVTPRVSGPAGEDITAKQLQELEALWSRFPVSMKTGEEQQKELDALYKKSGLKPPSEAEISRQLDELERLRK